jgi:hypothetical protein
MRTVYIVGCPGSGKSTAMAGALDLLDWHLLVAQKEPVPHLLYDSGAAQLGSARVEMGGTDSLSMSIGPKAIDWVRTQPVPLLLGEGDRLAYDGFLNACHSVGPVELVWIDVPFMVARNRALARNDKAQNWTWVKGRFAKVENLVSRHHHIRIDGNQLPSVVASELAVIIGRDA